MKKLINFLKSVFISIMESRAAHADKIVDTYYKDKVKSYYI